VRRLTAANERAQLVLVVRSFRFAAVRFFISRQLAPQRGLKFLVAFRVEVRPTRLIRRSMGPNPARSRLMHCGNGTTVDYLPLWQVAMARTLDLP